MATTAAPSVELGPLGLENPMGTDGFEFVEYAAPDPELLRALFTKMGFPAVARHKRKNVTLHRRATSTSSSMPSPTASPSNSPRPMARRACAMAFRVKDARAAHASARSSLGATDVESDVAAMASSTFRRSRALAARASIFVDRYGDKGHRSTTSISTSIPTGSEQDGRATTRKLTYLDHLTHNVNRGRMSDLGRILRAALQLPRDPLLRHRGKGHRPLLQGDDLALRQDPHPPEREPGRQEPDRGIPARI